MQYSFANPEPEESVMLRSMLNAGRVEFRIRSILFAGSVATASAACGDPSTPEPDEPAVVIVEPAIATLDALGVTAEFRATARSSSGEVISGRSVVWSTSDPGVASVSSVGVVTSVGNGDVEVRARVGSSEGVATLMVRQIARAVSITPTDVELSIGETEQFSVVVSDGNGRSMTTDVVWTSSDARVVMIDAAGRATAAGAGSATVEARAGQVSAQATIFVSAALRFATVSAGGDHTCALTAQGAAWCWGSNLLGQLGSGSMPRSLAPVRVQIDATLTDISAGYGHTCAVADDHAVWCWGNSDRGQVGDGGLGVRTQPSRVLGGHAFSAVEAGRAHTCGRSTAGLILCWGWGGNGEMGNGATVNRIVPDTIFGGGRYSSLGGSAHTICAVLASGAADCWGRNNTGQIGDGTVTCTSLSSGCFSQRALPTRVQSNVPFSTISAGARISNGFGGGTACALSPSNQAFCWGQNANGQAGDGTQTARLTPVIVSGGHQWQTIDVGSATVCGLLLDGTARCWGYNGTGVVGDGTSVHRLVPVPVTGALRFDDLSVGFDHACGVAIGGDVYCWGGNANGQLGDGTTTPRLVPVRAVPVG